MNGILISDIMKTYLEIQVPLRNDAAWFKDLRSICQYIDVRWQMGHFHITMAFIDETPTGVDLCPLLEKYLRTFTAPILSFDKLDAFTSNSTIAMFISNKKHTATLRSGTPLPRGRGSCRLRLLGCTCRQRYEKK